MMGRDILYYLALVVVIGVAVYVTRDVPSGQSFVPVFR
jgi:hypothetical protein